MNMPLTPGQDGYLDAMQMQNSVQFSGNRSDSYNSPESIPTDSQDNEGECEPDSMRERVEVMLLVVSGILLLAAAIKIAFWFVTGGGK